MLALPPIGQVLGDLPSSALANRVGDRRAMMFAAGGAVTALIFCFFARSLFVLGPGLLLVGLFNSTYYLGRQSYIIDVVPLYMRARAMSTLGGSHRIGLFCGPFIGAALIALTNFRAAYLLAMVCAAGAAFLLLVVPDVERVGGHQRPPRGNQSLVSLLAEHRKMLLSVGSAVFAFSALRAARQVVVPLWGVHLGLGAEKISLVFGVASAVDMALFYPAGKVMDHFGRLAIVIPSSLLLGVTAMFLPLTHTVWTLAIVAILMAFANGVGSGIQMTIAADLAPSGDRIRFLSMWRVWGDGGQASGPLALSAIAAVLSLGAGIFGVGLLGIYAAAAYAHWLPRYSKLATPASVRAIREAATPADSG